MEVEEGEKENDEDEEKELGGACDAGGGCQSAFIDKDGRNAKSVRYSTHHRIVGTIRSDFP